MGLLFALAPTPASRGLAEQLRAGVIALQSGQSERALGEFELALALEPELSAAHWLAAHSAMMLGAPMRARGHLDASSGLAGET